MPLIAQLDERVQGGAPFTEDEMGRWIMDTDVENSVAFFGTDMAAARIHAARIADAIITKYLNNPDIEAVPLRRKTQLCLALSNMSLNPEMRPVIFDALGKLVSFFEEAMTLEGKMRFDPELGRMTEHVIVLVMRVTNYSLTASGMFEFVEGNFQFAVQLLLAVLLKMPAYELDLRCCCLRCLQGFTQPQAFFSAGEKIEETSCDAFTEKVNFTLGLMMKMDAVQVVSDVLYEALVQLSPAVSPVVHGAICSTMRCIMNIFQFSSRDSAQWRQHILLSTSFIDYPITIYMQLQTHAFTGDHGATSAVTQVDVAKGLALGLRFCTFATFHLGSQARSVRAFCMYLLSLLGVNVGTLPSRGIPLRLVKMLYTNLLHFLCNVDALQSGPDFDNPADAMSPELSTETFASCVRTFLNSYASSLGMAQAQELRQAFLAVRSDTLVALDSETYKSICRLLDEAVAPQAVAPTPAHQAPTRTILGDLPSLKKPKKTQKVSIEKAAEMVVQQNKLSVVTTPANVEQLSNVDKTLLCALSGNVMKNPVISPYGQTYDKDAIEQWLHQNGSICPITGKSLTLADLVPNKAVASKIIKQAIQQSMDTKQANNDDDLYDF